MPIQLKPIKNQTLVITGASSGIGLATAREAAGRGARVVLAARDTEALATICEGIRAKGGEAVWVGADVGDEAQVAAIAAKALEAFGGFDSWVNDAGVGVISPVEDLSTADHRRLFDTNYWGVVYGSLAALRHFRQTGQAGAIINLGSLVSELPLALNVAYSASKHAIKGFTDGLRLELMHDKRPIAVTLIKPSGIDSMFFKHAKSNVGPMGRAPGPVYAPEVVARAIVHAAAHPTREIAVGSAAVIGTAAADIAPALVEGFEAASPYSMYLDGDERPDADSLNEVPREGRVSLGRQHGRTFSVTTAAQLHPTSSMLALAVIGGTALVLGAALQRRGG